MSVIKSLAFDEVCQRGCIHARDVERMRNLLYSEGEISELEIEGLLEINDACRVQDPAWSALLVEAVSEYVVHDAEPSGYLTTANADWLISNVVRSESIASRAEFSLMLEVLRKSRWSPPSLVAFALTHVLRAVETGEGPLRAGRPPWRGYVLPDDVVLIRSILQSAFGSSCLAMTRAEAEVLFEIDAALAKNGACPAWIALFVQAISNVILTTGGYRAPKREVALGEEIEAGTTVAPMSDAMVWELFRQALGRVIGAYRRANEEELGVARLERQRIEIITGEPIEICDAAWLHAKLIDLRSPAPVREGLLDLLHRVCPGATAIDAAQEPARPAVA